MHSIYIFISVATCGVKYIFSNKLQFDKLLTGDDDLTNWGVKFEVEKGANHNVNKFVNKQCKQ